jgi:hypothetical protein
MKLLIIEDNDIKFDLVIDHLKTISHELTLRRAASYQSAIEALVEDAFGCVILDMTLPTYDAQHSVIAEAQLTFGGQLVLRETARRRIRAQFIVLSQYDSFLSGDKVITFDELRRTLVDRYDQLILGCVRLDTSSVQWKADLGSFINIAYANTNR